MGQLVLQLLVSNCLFSFKYYPMWLAHLIGSYLRLKFGLSKDWLGLKLKSDFNHY
jgi:hypothetical protein